MAPDPFHPEAARAARAELVSDLSGRQRETLRWHWPSAARPGQLPPPGEWRTWLIMAGRGFGKTRAGAEWVREVARTSPDARIALVASSLAEARSVMVEGESGLVRCGPPARRPRFEPSLRRLTWPGGAQATLYSAADPETLRGPQHSHAWCDEIAKWDNAGGRAEAAWDNLALGLRLGRCPRALATTTPRHVPLLARLLAGEASGDTVVTRGTTYDNAANLPARFIDDMRRTYGGSTLGRQELDGELIAEIEGALWSRRLLESVREDRPPAMVRVVIGVDPPAGSRGDACGIVVCGLGDDGLGHVLADTSVENASPERWARTVAVAARTWHADRIVAEANQGGDMVGAVLRAANAALPVRLVHARHGKVARAEPVAALYEAGRVRHAAVFPQLEDQLCGMGTAGRYLGPGRSPDRADAAVWALTELLLGHAGEPRLRWD